MRQIFKLAETSPIFAHVRLAAVRLTGRGSRAPSNGPSLPTPRLYHSAKVPGGMSRLRRSSYPHKKVLAEWGCHHCHAAHGASLHFNKQIWINLRTRASFLAHATHCRRCAPRMLHMELRFIQQNILYKPTQCTPAAATKCTTKKKGGLLCIPHPIPPSPLHPRLRRRRFCR